MCFLSEKFANNPFRAGQHRVFTGLALIYFVKNGTVQRENIGLYPKRGDIVIKAIRRYLRTTDTVYLFMCLCCSALSVLALASLAYSAGGFETDAFTGEITGLGQYRDVIVQAGASVLGIVCAVILSQIDYHNMVNAWPVHVIFAWGLVALTLTHGLTIGPLTLGYAPSGTDNYSWIRFSFLSLQPTELAKISFILTFSMHLNNVRERINEPKELAKLLLHILAPVLVIHIQGDDGTAIVFGCIGLMMLFAAGISWRYIITAGVLAVAGGAGLIALFPDKILKSYQFDRIMAVIYPDDPQYKDVIQQQKEGLTAIGSGQIFGRGFFNDDSYSVINAHNDFIFSYLGECIGFVGCAIVLALLFGIAIKTLVVGMQSQDHIGTYICAGVFAAISWQIIINLGMNLSVLPVIGITLPFFSAGGTSVLMLYLCVGLVLSVYRHNKKTLFSD